MTRGKFPDDCDDIEYYEWAKVYGKVKKVVKSVDVEEAIESFNEQVKVLKAHIFVKRTQNTHYNRLKENLKTNEFIIHVDYSENYKDKEQDEIQSAYFGYNSFSIFTACCYTREIGSTLLNKDFTVTSETTDHSRIAAFSCINLIIDLLQKKFPSQFNNYPVFYIWSDGCTLHFWSRFVFALMTHFNTDYTIQWYYKERHHGKGPMYGVGGTVKNMIFQHVQSKKCVINGAGAKDFAEYANKIINGISCLYLAESEIMAEPQDIETSPKIPRTLKVHKVLRTYHDDNVCKMEFYKLADEADPFHLQWYRKESDPEVCGRKRAATAKKDTK